MSEVVDLVDKKPPDEAVFAARHDAPDSQVLAAAEAVVVPPPELAAPRASEQRGELVLPSGAARAVSWALADRELRVAAEVGSGLVKRAFLLLGPPRLVFDVDGAAPKKSHALVGAGPYIKRVRVGRQGASATRVVVDLARAPADVSVDGDALILSFE